MLNVGDPAPPLVLEDDRGETFDLAAQAGKKVLLVFYPGDDTPVCTRQLCDYRDGIESFEGLGVTVVGISGDDGESHRRFRSKYDLPFTLLSDPGKEVIKMYDVDGMFGVGVQRATFLISQDRTIQDAVITVGPRERA